MEEHHHVVSRPYETSNIGSNLASLGGAVWLARRLSRDLIVDWRGLSQLRDKSLNYFSEFFATPTRLCGVEAHYAPVAGHHYDRSEDDAVWLSPAEAREAAGGAVPSARYVVLQPYHGLDRIHDGSESERFRLLREFYREIRPAPALEAEIERWTRERLDGAFVVGVNVRTGNGKYFGRGMEYAGRVNVEILADGRRLLRVLERACRDCLRRLPRPLRHDFVVFYATDSEPMSELLSALPNAVTRRRVFPPPGEGDLYEFEEPGRDRVSVEETVADMFLLAGCDALVYNSSLFNQYARVLTGSFSGNLIHIEDRFVRTRLKQVGRALRRRVPPLQPTR